MSTIKTSGNAFANLIDRRKDTGNNQYIEGLGGNDTLYGSALDDTIDGGTGADTMYGGAGNDLYFVNSASDSVIEDATGGIDTISTTVSIDLSASASRFQNVENLTVNASVLSLFAMSLGGNAAANVLTGHAGVDTLKGYGGNDTLLGLAGNDSLDGGEGDDLLDGGIGNDKLLGGAGNDTLLGGTGNDTLDGGAGNDSFYVDSSTDVVLEAADAGTDTLYTTLNTFDLNKTANVEGLVFQGAGAAKLTGNALANTLTGGAGNDTLLGGDGNDTLIASAGADVLTGGTGDDRFVIRAGASGTRITDFGNGSTAAGDHIVIDAGVQAPTDLWFQQDTTAGTMTLTVLSTGQTVTIASWDATHAQPWLGQPANPALVAARVDVVIDGSTSSLNMLDVQRLAEVCATLTPPVGGFQNLSAADQAYYQDSIRRVWTQHTLPLVRRPGTAGDDTLTGTTFGGDYLDGQDGNDLLIASDDASTQAIPPKVPYTIDDLLLGGAGNDTLVGGAGADTLMGGAGNDSYVVNFNHGFGYATTIDDTTAPGEANSLKLGAQLLSDPSHFRFARVPGTSNLQISLPAGEVSPGTVQVNGWFDGTARQLATINFGSRTLTAAQVNTLVGLWATYDQADATGKAAAISAITGLWSGSSGLYIPGTSGAETLTGGQGNDTLQGAAGNDTLDGGRGANVLDGGDDDDTLFSAGGNDTVTGGHGVDRFVVHAGSGDTRITDFTQNNTFDAGEHLVIDAGMLAPSDLWFKSDATAGTLVITVLSTGQTITVAAWRPDRALTTPAGPADPGWVAAKVDVVIDGSTHALDAMDVQRLADVCAAMPQPAGGFQSLNADDQAYYLASIARVWDQHTLPLTRVPGTAGDDTLSGGTFTGDFLDGRDGNDLLNARDDLGTPIPPKTPYTMDDLLSGGAGNDTLMGGAGADTLLGGSGNDTYQFFFTPGRSYAATLADTAAPGEANVLQLRAQFGEPYQYRFARVAGSSDLQISLSGTSSGAIRVSGWFDDAAKQLAVIDFGSKAITNDQANALVDLWSAYDQAADDAGKTAALTAITGFWNGNVNHYVAGTSAADALFGFQGNDTLLGAAGNDTLNGGTGTDALEGGYGSDTYLIGHDASAVITDHGSAPDTDTLAFTDASYDALTWQLADGGHTLEIGVAGTTQRVRLPDWQTAANQIEQVQANSPEGTLTLDAQHLAALVSAMASATPPQGAELRAYWQAPLMAVAPGTLPS